MLRVTFFMRQFVSVYFLAFKRRLMYNERYKKVAQSLLGLSFMPARTLNDFFAGFSYGQIRVDLKVSMATPLQKGQEGAEEIKVEGKRRPSRSRHSKSYKVVCSGCGGEVVIPVLPPDDRELLCFSRIDSFKEEI